MERALSSFHVLSRSYQIDKESESSYSLQSNRLWPLVTEERDVDVEKTREKES